MHSLILKTLFAYWLAASVVIIASDLQPHKLIHTPELSDALDTSLGMVGQSLLAAEQSGTCQNVGSWHIRSSDAIGLVTPSGSRLCGTLSGAGLEDLIARSATSGKRMTRDFTYYQVIAVPLISPHGQESVLLVKSGYTSALEVFGFLPGAKTIQISLVVTFFLVLLIVLPLRRVRSAAQRISDGDLDARVEAGLFSRSLAKIGLRDDIDGLMRDFNGMASRLQTVVSAQKLLLRDVSHELRSPLARLAVALELARDQFKDQPSAQILNHLNRIERESLRINALIGHILSFSYIETIGDKHQSVELSLSSLIDELLPDVQYEAENRSCRIVTSAEQDLIVKGDSDMLRHAVENIVRNAIRYSPPGGTVNIEINAGDRLDKPTAVLRVSDAGPGVAEEKLSQILNPFYRADSTRHGSTSGFGIGLAIADRAAHLHSGRIIARNRKGGGLVVEMCLPLAPLACS